MAKTDKQKPKVTPISWLQRVLDVATAFANVVRFDSAGDPIEDERTNQARETIGPILKAFGYSADTDDADELAYAFAGGLAFLASSTERPLRYGNDETQLLPEIAAGVHHFISTHADNTGATGNVSIAARAFFAQLGFGVDVEEDVRDDLPPEYSVRRGGRILNVGRRDDGTLIAAESDDPTTGDEY